MKTKEELNALKEEVEALNRKLAELTGEELVLVTGGTTASSGVIAGSNGHGGISANGGRMVHVDTPTYSPEK